MYKRHLKFAPKEEWDLRELDRGCDYEAIERLVEKGLDSAIKAVEREDPSLYKALARGYVGEAVVNAELSKQGVFSTKPDGMVIVDNRLALMEVKDKLRTAFACNGQECTGMGRHQYDRYMLFYRMFNLPCMVVMVFRDQKNTAYCHIYYEWMHVLDRGESDFVVDTKKEQIKVWPLKNFRRKYHGGRFDFTAGWDPVGPNHSK